MHLLSFKELAVVEENKDEKFFYKRVGKYVFYALLLLLFISLYDLF